MHGDTLGSPSSAHSLLVKVLFLLASTCLALAVILGIHSFWPSSKLDHALQAGRVAQTEPLPTSLPANQRQRPTVEASPTHLVPTATPLPRSVAPATTPTGVPPEVDTFGSDFEIPAEVLLDRVPIGKQARSLSCELQCASDLAWYYGKPYTWEEIFQQVGHDPGGNPHKGFVGRSLDDRPGQVYPGGYGVYAEPVAQALRNLGLPADVHYGEPDRWVQEQLARGRPIMVWVTGGMVVRPVEEWKAADGTVVRGTPFEHACLVIGYKAEGVWVGDPWDGQRHFYPWDVFLRAWDLFDRMAIIVAEQR